jgi:hypothetical protein
MALTVEIDNKDLPYWMQQARRGVDWGVLLVIAYSLALAWPFLLQPGLPHTNASENYVYRTADYAEAIQEGRLYPRWSPHVFSGYGAPIPHYYPPGAPYSAALVQVLFTGDPVTAVRIVYAASLCLSGSMMYVFVTRRAGSAAGVLAAVFYVASPYVGMTAPHILGDLPGIMALALLPTLLWAVDRLLILNRPHDIALVALTVAALLLTSPRDSILGLALAALLVAWHLWANDRHARWLLVVIAVILGIGLASFFWLPALVEYDAVQWRPPAAPSTLRLSPYSLFAPMRPVDLAEMIPSPQLTMGLVSVGAATLGLVGAILKRRHAAFQMVFLFAGVALIVLALTAFSTEVWLLGSIAFCMAVGGSALLHLRCNLPARWQRLLLPALLVIVLIGSYPVWLAPRWSEAFGNTDPQAQLLYEQQNQGVAVLPPHVPVPATIPDTLLPNRSLTDGYLTGNINKIAIGQLGSSVRIGVLGHQTHGDRFQYSATRPTSLHILTAYFPGWQATLSGRAVPLSADAETGLIQVDVPVARNEELSIFLGPTSIRTGAWAISWASLAITLILTIGRMRRRTGIHDDLALLSPPEARLVGIVLGCFGVIILAFATPSSPLTLHTRPGYMLDNSYALRSRTDVGLEAIAYRLNQFAYRPGETLELTLYWQTLRPLGEDYQLQLSLLSSGGVPVLQTPFSRPGGYTSRRWLPSRYVRDHHDLHLPPTIAPGVYNIALEVHGCAPDCNQPVNFFNQSGNLIGPSLILPSPITISP